MAPQNLLNMDLLITSEFASSGNRRTFDKDNKITAAVLPTSQEDMDLVRSMHSQPQSQILSSSLEFNLPSPKQRQQQQQYQYQYQPMNYLDTSHTHSHAHAHAHAHTPTYPHPSTSSPSSSSSHLRTHHNFRTSSQSTSSRRKRRTFAPPSPASTSTSRGPIGSIIKPLSMIQSLLTPGASAASCNEETLSSSFLILDGFLTISLGQLANDDDDHEEEQVRLEVQVEEDVGGDTSDTITNEDKNVNEDKDENDDNNNDNNDDDTSRDTNDSSDKSIHIHNDKYHTTASSSISMLHEATERWGARLETHICVGKVSYEYRHENEEEEEKCMSFSSSDGDEEDCVHMHHLSSNANADATAGNEIETEFEHGPRPGSTGTGTGPSILSQKLDLIPLVLDDPATLALDMDSSRAINPERYVPPCHKMVADCLKFREYVEATEVYFDILKADRERYGESDLVCAVDYHNLGVTNLLAGDLDSALHYFQESVLLKRACLGKNDITAADSLVEIGIILYMKGDLKGALSLFNEALEVYINDNHVINTFNSNTRSTIDTNTMTDSKSNESPSSSCTSPSCSCLDSIGRTYNNIGCVHYRMGDKSSSLLYMQKSLAAQRNALGLNSKAESALLSYALTQANTGYLKCKSGHLDAVALMEESLLVLESVIGVNNKTVTDVQNNISFAKQQ